MGLWGTTHGVGELESRVCLNETLELKCFRQGCSGLACHNGEWHGVVRSGRLGLVACMFVDSRLQSKHFIVKSVCLGSKRASSSA